MKSIWDIQRNPEFFLDVKGRELQLSSRIVQLSSRMVTTFCPQAIFTLHTFFDFQRTLSLLRLPPRYPAASLPPPPPHHQAAPTQRRTAGEFSAGATLARRQTVDSRRSGRSRPVVRPVPFRPVLGVGNHGHDDDDDGKIAITTASSYAASVSSGNLLRFRLRRGVFPLRLDRSRSPRPPVPAIARAKSSPRPPSSLDPASALSARRAKVGLRLSPSRDRPIRPGERRTASARSSLAEIGFGSRGIRGESKTRGSSPLDDFEDARKPHARLRRRGRSAGRIPGKAERGGRTHRGSGEGGGSEDRARSEGRESAGAGRDDGGRWPIDNQPRGGARAGGARVSHPNPRTGAVPIPSPSNSITSNKTP